jgi:arginine exporter protein ArgO
MTILSFAAIFAGMGLAGPEGDPAGAGFMVVGVFLGSAVWWLFLSTAAGLVHSRLSARRLSLINKAFGVIIVCLGALVLLGAVA